MDKKDAPATVQCLKTDMRHVMEPVGLMLNGMQISGAGGGPQRAQASLAGVNVHFACTLQGSVRPTLRAFGES